jgi:protein-S-isoprenylcysteine O-methyltransferase Ste14
MAWSISRPAGLRAIISVVTGMVFLSFVTASIVLPIMLERRFGFNGYMPAALTYGGGAPLLAVGAILTAWSIARFLIAKGTPAPLNPPQRLVTDGPYVYSRNPMLGGIFIMYFGAGALLNSPTVFFLVTPALIAAAWIFVKNVEEPELVARFGRDYIEYREKTPMFFPRLFKS